LSCEPAAAPEQRSVTVRALASVGECAPSWVGTGSASNIGSAVFTVQGIRGGSTGRNRRTITARGRSSRSHGRPLARPPYIKPSRMA
jgi:hypothetical protein